MARVHARCFRSSRVLGQGPGAREIATLHTAMLLRARDGALASVFVTLTAPHRFGEAKSINRGIGVYAPPSRQHVPVRRPMPSEDAGHRGCLSRLNMTEQSADAVPAVMVTRSLSSSPSRWHRKRRSGADVPTSPWLRDPELVEQPLFA